MQSVITTAKVWEIRMLQNVQNKEKSFQIETLDLKRLFYDDFMLWLKGPTDEVEARIPYGAAVGEQ